MTHEPRSLPSLDALKDQAKRLRSRLASEGEEISHSKSLELISAQYGYRNWNTLHAAVGNRPSFNPWMLGSRASKATISASPSRRRSSRSKRSEQRGAIV
jgi:hypothetical protein